MTIPMQNTFYQISQREGSPLEGRRPLVILTNGTPMAHTSDPPDRNPGHAPGGTLALATEMSEAKEES